MREPGTDRLLNKQDARQVRPAELVLSRMGLAPRPAEWLKIQCEDKRAAAIQRHVPRSLEASLRARSIQALHLSCSSARHKSAHVVGSYATSMTYQKMRSSRLPSGPGGKNQKNSCGANDFEGLQERLTQGGFGQYYDIEDYARFVYLARLIRVTANGH